MAFPKKRILIVDDSIVVRKILSGILSEDPELEIAGTASNGEIALAKFPTLRPDFILLDVEMPQMDGLTTLKELRKIDPRVPIVMFSTLTERGAATTLTALSLGASDYVAKPSNTQSLGESAEMIRGELIPKVKALCKIKKIDLGQRPPVSVHTVPPIRLSHKVDVVAIGTSTGGPNALAQVIPGLAKDFPVPIVIVQHMPATFTKLLAERLTAQSSIPVKEAVEGSKLVPGQAWLAPGGRHMVVERDTAGVQIKLNNDPPENFCRPAVDVLFRSIAKVYGPNALAVVLTGMGSDGLIGCRAIRDVGGDIILQDEPTSVVWGMPGSIYQAGVCQSVYPLPQIATEISRIATGFHVLAAKRG